MHLMASPVITNTNLQRIRSSLYTQNNDSWNARKLKMLELQRRSSARVGTWRNTLEAQREQALMNRARRLELVEQREQMLEAEEEKIRQAERQMVVGRAQRIQFEQNESIQKLTSAGLLSDVLIERRFCQQVKKIIKNDEKLKEEHFQAAVKTELDSANLEEHRRMLQRKTKQLQNAAEILAQKNQAEEKRKQMALEEQQEGERVRQKISQIRLEDQAKEMERIAQQQRSKEERLNALNTHREEVARNKARDEHELLQATLKADEHQRRVDLLKAKQEERKRLRRELRERLNQQVIDSLPPPPADNSEVENQKILIAEQSVENDRFMKQQKAQREMQKMIAAQMEAHAKARLEQQQQREKTLLDAHRALEEFKSSQIEAERVTRERNRQLAQFHRTQMEAKKLERDRSRSQTARNSMDIDQDRVKQFADSLIATYRKEGDDIALPIMLVAERGDGVALRRFRPQRPTDPF